MKFNLTHEKTTFIPIEGQVVQVSSLPEELKNEIESLDRIMQKKIDILLELEIIELAGVLKTSQIQQMVIAHIKKIKEGQQPATVESEKVNENQKQSKKK